MLSWQALASTRFVLTHSAIVIGSIDCSRFQTICPGWLLNDSDLNDSLSAHSQAHYQLTTNRVITDI